MHHSFLDRYSRLESPIHKIPASIKMLISFLLLLLLLLTPQDKLVFFIFYGTALLLIAALSRIPFSFIFLRLIMLETFVVSVSLLSLYHTRSTSTLLWLIARSSLGILLIIILSNTTRFTDILLFLKQIRFPAVLITTLSLLYRYIFVLIDEAERMNRARKARTFKHKHFLSWHINAEVIGQLFVRSVARAERIYAAMSSRGWKP